MHNWLFSADVTISHASIEWSDSFSTSSTSNKLENGYFIFTIWQFWQFLLQINTKFVSQINFKLGAIISWIQILIYLKRLLTHTSMDSSYKNKTELFDMNTHTGQSKKYFTAILSKIIVFTVCFVNALISIWCWPQGSHRSRRSHGTLHSSQHINRPALSHTVWIQRCPCTSNDQFWSLDIGSNHNTVGFEIACELNVSFHLHSRREFSSTRKLWLKLIIIVV